MKHKSVKTYQNISLKVVIFFFKKNLKIERNISKYSKMS